MEVDTKAGTKRAAEGTPAESSLHDILEAAKQDILAQSQQLLVAKLGAATTASETYIDGKVDKINAKVDKHEGELVIIKEQQADLTRRNAELTKSIRDLQEKLAVEEPVLKKYPERSDDNRDYFSFDGTIIRVNSKNKVARPPLFALVKSICAEADVDETLFTLSGGEHTKSNRWTLDLHAMPDVATAARRVRKILNIANRNSVR